MRTTDFGQSALLLLDVISFLKNKKIPHAVIGAMAASYYGVVRASLDADAVISIAISELPKLEEIFRIAGFTTILRRGDFNDPIPALLELSDRYENRVDLLVGIRGMEAKAFQRAMAVPFHGTRLKMIGLEDFVAMKIFAGSPKDLDDAQNALRVSGKKLDKPLLIKLTKQYGKECLASLERLLKISQ